MFGFIKNCANVAARLRHGFSPVSNFHHFSKPQVNHKFLAPATSEVTIFCGLKVKGRVRRRCKDCYMVFREQRLYVLCKTHGRHKQVTVTKDPKNTWILSHATQGKVRPW